MERLIQPETEDAARSVAVIASTMRSGSTLLKALLATAEDISDLPETNFQQFRGEQARQRILELATSRIVVLKRPAWYHESKCYPRLPATEVKAILLVRDVYETVKSLQKMTFRKAHAWFSPLVNSWLVGYWANVMEQLLQLRGQANAKMIRYEDLTEQPIACTAELFAFLGSSRHEGADAYGKPEHYDWKWGKDDGGPNIKTLKVQPPKRHGYEDKKLLRTILKSDRTLQVRQQLGYSDFPSI